MLKPVKKFRIVERDLTTLIDLNDYETLRLIEVLGENIALTVPTPLPLMTVLTNFPRVFGDSIERFDGELHLYTSNDITPHKTAPRKIPLFALRTILLLR